MTLSSYAAVEQSRTKAPARGPLRAAAYAWGLLILLALCLWVPAAYATVDVGPMIVRPVVRVGQSLRFVLTATNSDATKRDFTVTLKNMTGAPQGFPVAAPDDAPRGCAKWISLSPQSFTLQPNTAQKITCDLRVPPGAGGGYYALITVRSPSPESLRAAIGLTMGQSFGTAVLLSVPGPKVAPLLKVDSIRVGMRPSSAKETGGWRIESGVRNEGTIHTQAMGTYRLRSAAGALLSNGSLDAGSATVLASAVRTFAADGTRTLADGVYLATVQFEVPGTRISATGTLAFQVQAGKIKEVENTPEILALLASQQPVVALAPDELSLVVAPGGRTTRAVTLTNGGKELLHLGLAGAEFQLTETGDEDFPTVAPQHSALAWLSLTPQEMDVARGGRGSARVEVAVPADTPPGDYFAALRVRNAGAPGSPFYPAYTIVRISVGRLPEASCEIADLVIDKPNTSRATATAVVRNTGSCVAWPIVSLQVSDASGATVVSAATLAAGNAMVLPGQQRCFKVLLDPIPRPGKCHAIVTVLACENGKPSQRDVAFDAPAWQDQASAPASAAANATP